MYSNRQSVTIPPCDGMSLYVVGDEVVVRERLPIEPAPSKKTILGDKGRTYMDSDPAVTNVFDAQRRFVESCFWLRPSVSATCVDDC